MTLIISIVSVPTNVDAWNITTEETTTSSFNLQITNNNIWYFDKFIINTVRDDYNVSKEVSRGTNKTSVSNLTSGLNYSIHIFAAIDFYGQTYISKEGQRFSRFTGKALFSA